MMAERIAAWMLMAAYLVLFGFIVSVLVILECFDSLTAKINALLD